MRIESLHNEPMRLNMQAIGEGGSVRPTDSNTYIRQPYQSLDHVLGLMQSQVQKWKGDQRIRQKAVEITKGIKKDSRTGLPNRRDYQAIADAIYSWMKKNIAYVRDPDGIELLQSPLKTIEYGNGDCDDHSILAASLLSSLGVPVKFKVVKADPSNKNAYSHIYVVYNADGSWKGFDTTLHAKAGAELNDSRMFGEKFVSLSDARFGNALKKKSKLSTKNMTIQQSSKLGPNGRLRSINTGLGRIISPKTKKEAKNNDELPGMKDRMYSDPGNFDPNGGLPSNSPKLPTISKPHIYVVPPSATGRNETEVDTSNTTKQVQAASIMPKNMLIGTVILIGVGGSLLFFGRKKKNR